MNCKLKFNLDNDNRPYIETFDMSSMADDQTAPVFSNQYKYALGQIEHYLSSMEDDNDVRFTVDNTNNIFAFLGERGSGKTSCMMSLAKHLTNKMQRSSWGDIYPNVVRRDFEFIRIIDPSFFDTNHNLLALFIAQLYREFNDNCSRDDDKNKDYIKTQLLSKFCSAQMHMQQMLAKDVDQTDDKLEQLSALSAAIQLRDDIKELVDKYLEYKDKKDCQLLVCVDDIDLNATEAGRMAEEIRKYFVHPNILVFISLKLDQLENIKRKDFNTLFGDKAQPDEIDEMVERYFAKLLPHSQRIYMPDTEVFFEDSVCLFSKNMSEKQRKNYEFCSVRQAIPQLIFWKTRYLFYNTERYTSFIVPRNLRELRQLFKLLGKMEDYRAEGSEPSAISLYNKRLFKKYFFENWTINNLTPDYRKKADVVVHLENNMFFNKMVINVLCEVFPLKYSGSGENKPVYDDLLNPANSSCNISMGDVLGYISILEMSFVDEDHRKFLFFLKTLCSIRLYEAYDEVTEKQFDYERKNDEIFFDGKFQKINAYGQLVNGDIINSRLFGLYLFSGKVVPLEFSIKTEQLASIMHFCVSKWDYALNKGLVRLVEIIMLCTARMYEAKGEYRTTPIPLYSTDISNGKILFIPESFFFNITRIKECYSRFEKITLKDENVGGQFISRLYEEKSLASSYTLIDCFFQETMKEKHGVKGKFLDWPLMKYNNSWLSLCSFRNAEIVQDFCNFVSQKLNEKQDDLDLIINFFEVASKYVIKTYDRDPSGKPYVIRFAFSKYVADTLKMDRVKCSFMDLIRDSSSVVPGADDDITKS